MPDRSIPPRIYPVEELQLPEPLRYNLANGIPVYVTDMGGQEVVQLDLVIEAGRPWERKPAVARTLAALLREGTDQHNGADLAERFDFLGCSLHMPTHLDHIQLSVQCLRKYAAEVFPLMSEIIMAPAFPENELHSFVRRQIKRLEVDLQKVDLLAYRELTESIFGPAHSYGYNSLPEHYQAVSRVDLLEHYRRTFSPGQAKIFLSGRIDQATLDLLEKHFGGWRGAPGSEPVFADTPERPTGRKLISKPDAAQTAIRMGRLLFDRKHPDYPAMYVLHTVLGGYFGSRLMANLREDKGYTYNVYSSLDTYAFDGFFYIGAEVDNRQVEASLHEVRRELNRLIAEPIPEDELAMVRNYLLGTMLNMLDGPFQVSELIKGLVVDGLTTSFFGSMVEEIRTITPEKLHQMAGNYLRPEEMLEVIAGAPDANA